MTIQIIIRFANISQYQQAIIDETVYSIFQFFLKLLTLKINYSIQTIINERNLTSNYCKLQFLL